MTQPSAAVRTTYEQSSRAVDLFLNVAQRSLALAGERPPAIVRAFESLLATIKGRFVQARAMWAEGQHEAAARLMYATAEVSREAAERLNRELATLAQHYRDAGTVVGSSVELVADYAVPSLPGAPRASEVIRGVVAAAEAAGGAAREAGIRAWSFARFLAWLTSREGLLVLAAAAGIYYFRAPIGRQLRKLTK